MNDENEGTGVYDGYGALTLGTVLTALSRGIYAEDGRHAVVSLTAYGHLNLDDGTWVPLHGYRVTWALTEEGLG